MNSKQLNSSVFRSWAGDSSGHLARCRGCGQLIYWCQTHHGWRPFESFVANNCAPGEWIRHRCADTSPTAMQYSLSRN